MSESISNAVAGSESTRSVVIERVFPHSPEKLWRALTESALIAQWLLKNDFEPIVGRQFHLHVPPMPAWDGVIGAEVLIVQSLKQLSYTWSALGLDSVVVFTLTPVDGGTQLRMEHSGFPPDQQAAWHGARHGWQGFLNNLEQLLQGDGL